MRARAVSYLLLCFGLLWLGQMVMADVYPAHAQFFWSPWFNDRPRRTREPPAPEPPAPSPDDLAPIAPEAELPPPPPPPPDDKPYDDDLLRLAEILGALHYLRELCGAEEGQLWREKMEQVVKIEGNTAVRRARLVNSFNDGYRSFRRTYRSCTNSATIAIDRFGSEGSKIALALASPSKPKEAEGKIEGKIEGKTAAGDTAEGKPGDAKSAEGSR